jgi:cytidylate kinase
MSIITISRGSYSKGKEVAEKVSAKLGYECLSRDILLEASETFKVPEIQLVRAIHDAPSLFGRLGFNRKQYIDFIQMALLIHLRRDNVVYHGLAGHFFVKNIPHVLKVRIIADLEERIKLEMERENISEAEARRIIIKDDQERRNWSKSLYGIDTADSRLYDLVIHISQITVDHAVDMICDTVKLDEFRTTAESQKLIEDAYMDALVMNAAIDLPYEFDVCSDSGVIVIRVDAPLAAERAIYNELQEKLKNIPGVKEFRLSVVPDKPFTE